MNKHLGSIAVTAIVIALLDGCGDGGAGDGTNVVPVAVGSPVADTQAPQQWNGIAIEALQNHAAVDVSGGFAPPDDGRILAMAFIAAHDALNAIDRRYQPYLTDVSVPDADPDAAVATAMHDVLKATIPTQGAYLDSQYDAALAPIAVGDAKTAGVALGRATAKAILAARTGDGSESAQGPYVSTNRPGDYRITPPYDFAGYVHEDGVKLFAVPDQTTFRAPPPPDLTDPLYTRDYNEIKMLGSIDSGVRSADQSQVALFWLENTTESWARIAASLARARRINGWDQARMYALLEIAIEDSYITVEGAKYAYARWRPVTAIHLGEIDGNPDTIGDPAWTPLRTQPPDPDYPSGHSGAAGAGASVLQDLLATDAVAVDYTSLSLPAATRSFTSLSQIAAEIAVSRVYVGFHFRNSTVQGQKQGEAIGHYVAGTALRPVLAR